MGRNPIDIGKLQVATATTRTDERTRVLQQGDTFAVFDRFGDIHSTGTIEQEQGLYHADTRFLSRLELSFGDNIRPLLLYSTITKDNILLIIDLTNPEFYQDGRITVPKDTVHLFRSKLLWKGACYEHFRIINYGETALDLPLLLRFDADFADIFEVRGTKREKRGEVIRRDVKPREVRFHYRGLDDLIRVTRICFSEPPERTSPGEAVFRFLLAPRESREMVLTISCEKKGTRRKIANYEKALKRSTAARRTYSRRNCTLFTSNEQFNDWLNRSGADLDMLLTETAEGPYPYAGVPWFSAPFGRDGILTALQTLWIRPEIARGVLKFLAATQARRISSRRAAEPGKILHEMRRSEMARCGEIVFGQYYGSVDATPLFILLAGAYYGRTGDRTLLEEIRPAIERALHWIERYGDMDGDGFIEYLPRPGKGLLHQGWKDSNDAIFHEDGKPAEGPIALCEVQGYVYGAWRSAARLAGIFGKPKRSRELEKRAETLKEAFHKAFWCEGIGTYALALDGKKRPCRVRSSNAGQTLFTGIAEASVVPKIVENLLAPASFSGWGIRTLSTTEANFNPMSYHNGSVWPHDNALIAMGLCRYGFRTEALRILTGLFNTSIYLDLHRLPELFCGFKHRPGQGPTLYPIACAPQAWAAATVFYLLQAVLGLSFEGDQSRILFRHPLLPDYLDQILIRNLSLNGATVDLTLQRSAQDVGINVMKKVGNVEISVIV